MRKSDPNSIRAMMSGEAKGPKAVMLRAGLSIIEPFYSCAMGARNFLYENGVFRSHDLGRPVIAFGNITTGGTGKTPLVLWTAEKLREAEFNVGILSRGYGATAENPLGDELTMLSHQLNDEQKSLIPLVANADRIAGAAKLLGDNPNVQAILLDDAFQHRRAERDLNIVLINATEPFGFAHVLPRGLLREPLAGLRRAGAIVLTHVNRVSESEISNLKSQIAKHAPAAPIYHTSHKLSVLKKPDGSAPLESLREVKFLGFCGIGTPAAFDRDISELGHRMGFHAYEDHHAYTADDLAMLKSQAKHVGATVLLTTEKDWVKLEPLITIPGALPIWRAEMRISFEANHESLLLKQIIDTIERGSK